MLLPFKFMLRIREIEKVQLMPNIWEILSVRDIERLSSEKLDLAEMIFKYSPEIRA